jgi:hypothetical protein
LNRPLLGAFVVVRHTLLGFLDSVVNEQIPLGKSFLIHVSHPLTSCWKRLASVAPKGARLTDRGRVSMGRIEQPKPDLGQHFIRASIA